MELQPATQLSLMLYEEYGARGAMRQRVRHAEGAVHRNNRTVSYREAEQSHMDAFRAEGAAWTFFPHAEWHNGELPAGHKLPDIGSFIDAKHIRQSWHKLLLPADGKGMPDWAYLLVLELPDCWFRMMGWAWGWQLMEVTPYEFQPGRPAHWLSPTMPPLYPIRDLQLIESWKRNP